MEEQVGPLREPTKDILRGPRVELPLEGPAPASSPVAPPLL